SERPAVALSTPCFVLSRYFTARSRSAEVSVCAEAATARHRIIRTEIAGVRFMIFLSSDFFRLIFSRLRATDFCSTLNQFPFNSGSADGVRIVPDWRLGVPRLPIQQLQRVGHEIDHGFERVDRTSRTARQIQDHSLPQNS